MLAMQWLALKVLTRLVNPTEHRQVELVVRYWVLDRCFDRRFYCAILLYL